MRILAIFLCLLAFANVGFGQAAGDTAELNRLLNEFLDGAGRNDVAIHDRFWAEDLIYTRGVGQRIGKEELMRGVRSAPPAKPTDPKTVYTAEDVKIQVYGETAVVAFRLVGKTTDGNKVTVTSHLNTGTFVKRNGRWQAAAWQATPVRKGEDAAKQEVLAAESAFHAAVAAADAKALRDLSHPGFVWTHSTGIQTPLEQFIAAYASGKLKYIKNERKNIEIAVFGDTAAVRGVSPRQVENEGKPSEPFVLHYTMTFVNSNGRWLAVAAHSSRSAN
ncbi:MAG: nuclear transport factor 2 family protein [Pyrinomonadaceae bacterium]|nr:nuclear transport factor 2 family protein [Pyrinomonadaceae bacterium]